MTGRHVKPFWLSEIAVAACFDVAFSSLRLRIQIAFRNPYRYDIHTTRRCLQTVNLCEGNWMDRFSFYFWCCSFQLSPRDGHMAFREHRDAKFVSMVVYHCIQNKVIHQIPMFNVESEN